MAGDAARLQQVGHHLLHNAVKFTPEGGRVSVALRVRGSRAELVVEDTGQGIASSLLPRVFDRFVQSESSTTRRQGGLGLGLAIVKQLMTLHGGDVRAESDGPGRGARFTVTLPLAAAGADPSAAVPAASRPDSSAGLPALDVLLVDDDLDSREAAELALKGHGLRVRVAGSVRDALRAYEEKPPDVLVSDIGMPSEDGYELIRTIRSREQGTPRRMLAVAITGFASRHDQEAALRAGFDDHVAKPVRPDVLVDRLRLLAAPQTGGD